MSATEPERLAAIVAEAPKELPPEDPPAFEPGPGESDARHQVIIESADPPAGVTVEAFRCVLAASLEGGCDAVRVCRDADEVLRFADELRWAYPKLRGGR